MLALLSSSCHSAAPSDSEAGESAPSREPEPEDPHAEARARLRAFEAEARERADFAQIPPADGRFGDDPYRVLALGETDGEAAFVALLRGADRVVLLDASGAVLRSAEAPHDPTDLALREAGSERELLVVGTGEARVARYDPLTLEPRDDLPLDGALSPRAITATDQGVWVADEALGRLHGFGEDLDAREPIPYCRGAIRLEAVAERSLLLANCLLEHRIRVDRISGPGTLEPEEAASFVPHDGPIWSFDLRAPDEAGVRLLALTGVEDHPLDRSDGSFGYIDSFVYVYELGLATDGTPTFMRRASVNTSELGVVTPKWSRWLPGEAPALITGGYATAPLLTLRWTAGLDAPPEHEPRPGLPGTSDAVLLEDAELLAASPLLDAFIRLTPADVELAPAAPTTPDDRSPEEHIGEALVYTTAMAPFARAEGKLSRFTCETCHFEGRGDGRVHFTGREFEGLEVHTRSKPLLGLFPNRPHFSRALDRTMAQMVDNEFRVANRHSGRPPWFDLDTTTLPWLRHLPGWPADGRADGELLRRSLMAFLMRWSMPQNPATRGRHQFTELEATGARLFATHCETCHQARLVADDASTRIPLGPDHDLTPWQRLVFSPTAPILWATDAYEKTNIHPWVHPNGTRIPSLRRLHLEWPYFTNGRAKTLEAVLEGIHLTPQGASHHLAPPKPDQALDPLERQALLAFLRLL